MLMIFVILFAIIGSMRGWAKELLVIFSVILAMFCLTVLENYVPFFKDIFANGTPETVFWLRTIILGGVVFFGYQTPKFPRLAESERFVRHFLQDALLGFFIGGINGYLIFGSLWYYLHIAGYPFKFVSAPDSATAIGQETLRFIVSLPPAWLSTSPMIYFAVGIAFILVIVVFI
jgi:Colicin V production protein.